MATRKITEKDSWIWKLLKDPNYRVTENGEIHTRFRNGGRGWRRGGWITPSRNGTKLYRRITYAGVELYEHRIVAAKKYGRLDPRKTIDHIDFNGLNNHPDNLRELDPSLNVQIAKQAYRRLGMSATEAKRNWMNSKTAGAVWRGKNAETEYR